MRCRVYSVPGGLSHPAHRREVLQGIDAVVFVADARGGANQANLDSLLELEVALKAQGVEMASIPMVIQVNHTDAEDARTSDDVVFDLNPYGFPVVTAIATEETGVLEAHQGVTEATLSRIRSNLSGQETAITLTTMHEEVRPKGDEVIRRHLEAIADYDVAVRLNPAYADTYVDRGNSQHALKEYNRAIRDYSEAIRLRPNFAEAYANRAAVHVESGDEAAAAADVESAYGYGIDREALDELLEEARRRR